MDKDIKIDVGSKRIKSRGVVLGNIRTMPQSEEYRAGYDKITKKCRVCGKVVGFGRKCECGE